jgi:hypothetical protein
VDESHECHNTLFGNTGKGPLFDASNIDERLTTVLIPQLLSVNTRLQLFDTSSLKVPHTFEPLFCIEVLFGGQDELLIQKCWSHYWLEKDSATVSRSSDARTASGGPK